VRVRSTALADPLTLAIVEHGPMSAAKLATAVAAHKLDVLAELKADPRLEQISSRRGSRWRLAGNRVAPAGPMGTDSDDGLGSDLTLRRSAAEERFVAVEQRLAALGAPRT
jgi:hypothetical protein